VKTTKGFRGWFYFRMGWSTYFVFILAAINTLTVTYFLAIDNYPSLKAVFPSFELYILITISIGTPLLILVGYSHYKKTLAYKSEADILVESNPYTRRNTVNADANVRLNLQLLSLLLKLSKNTISEEELEHIKKFQKEFEDLVKNRSFSNNLDIDFINQKIRKIGEK
tara:strand:- start:306 stop:809 length:504 start_codon:yes stop_codon:yes gene_type:complete